MITAIPPTPETVAAMLAEGDNDFHYGNSWQTSINATGSTVRIGVTPADEDDDADLPETRFCAVVVEGDETPIVLERPVELGIAGEYDEDVLSLTADGIRIRPPSAAWFDLEPDEAREWAAHLAAMADAREAAQKAEGGR